MNIIKGCTAILISPEGDVITSCSDFNKQGYGGFSLQEAQKIRCKELLALKAVKSLCSSLIYENLKEYTIRKIYEDLLNNGFKVHIEYIGD